MRAHCGAGAALGCVCWELVGENVPLSGLVYLSHTCAAFQLGRFPDECKGAPSLAGWEAWSDMKSNHASS